MRFALSSLREFLKGGFALGDLLERLEAVGVEVDAVVMPRTGFTVAKIVEACKHPNADKLRVCKVDCSEETLQIVCGAPNAREGLVTVLAMEGAVIPNDETNIERTSIRGVESFGMLCSEKELAIPAGDSKGIIELGSEWSVGESFFVDDPVLDVSITPNRGDLLSVCGLARELAASGLGELKECTVAEVHGGFALPLKIHNCCPERVVFGARYFKGLTNRPSPRWLKQRMQLLGLQSQSALVDITNYFNLVLARPMHVYDADCFKGDELTIAEASLGEKCEALDGKSYELDQGMLVVKSGQQVCSLLGIIGGQDSKCSGSTTNVLLEVAFVPPKVVMRARRTLGIDTDASYVFERLGAQIEEIAKFLHWASEFIVDICGGEPSELQIVGDCEAYRKPCHLAWQPEMLEAIAGFRPDDELVARILTILGFKLDGEGAEVPPWRVNNVENCSDLVEAIMRVHGYDKIPAKQSTGHSAELASIAEISNLDAEVLVVSRGMVEVLTWSFMHSKRLLSDCGKAVALVNPVRKGLDVMRTSMIPNLLDVASANIDRGDQDVAIFEEGAVYVNGEEQKLITGLRTGMSAPRNIYGLRHSFDFFDVKADVIAVLGEEGVSFSRDSIPSYYHPGRSASVRLNDELVAFCGELMPSVVKQADVASSVIVFEIFKYKLSKQRFEVVKQQFRQSNYPKVVRDFAFVFGKGLELQSLLDLVSSVDPALIRKAYVFDIYELEDGQQSIAICVVMQASDRTLNAEEIQEASDRIVAVVESQLGGQLRQAG